MRWVIAKNCRTDNELIYGDKFKNKLSNGTQI